MLKALLLLPIVGLVLLFITGKNSHVDVYNLPYQVLPLKDVETLQAGLAEFQVDDEILRKELASYGVNAEEFVKSFKIKKTVLVDGSYGGVNGLRLTFSSDLDDKRLKTVYQGMTQDLLSHLESYAKSSLSYTSGRDLYDLPPSIDDSLKQHWFDVFSDSFNSSNYLEMISLMKSGSLREIKQQDISSIKQGMNVFKKHFKSVSRGEYSHSKVHSRKGADVTHNLFFKTWFGGRPANDPGYVTVLVVVREDDFQVVGFGMFE